MKDKNLICKNLEDVNPPSYKIDDKQINELASKVSNSINDCNYCQIKRFCKEATACGTCEVTWATYLYKKIVL